MVFFFLFLNLTRFSGQTEFNSMSFINDIYACNTKFFVKKEPNPSNHLLGSIRFVGETICKDFLEIDLDHRLKTLSQDLKNSHFSSILNKNLSFYSFDQKIKEFNKKKGIINCDYVQITEILRKLAKIMSQPQSKTLKATDNRSFQENSRSAGVSDESMKFASPTSIHLYIHEIALMINDLIKVKILYGDTITEKTVNSGENVGFYEILNYREGKEILRIEVIQKV